MRQTPQYASLRPAEHDRRHKLFPAAAAAAAQLNARRSRRVRAARTRFKPLTVEAGFFARLDSFVCWLLVLLVLFACCPCTLRNACACKTIHRVCVKSCSGCHAVGFVAVLLTSCPCLHLPCCAVPCCAVSGNFHERLLAEACVLAGTCFASLLAPLTSPTGPGADVARSQRRCGPVLAVDLS